MNSKKSTKFYSNKQEKLIASALGWKQVTGSGARPNHPGDIEGQEWLGECKTHTAPNQPVVFYFDVWDKIVAEATSRFKSPALFVDDGSQELHHTYVMFDVTASVKLDDSLEDVADKKSFTKSTDGPVMFQRNGSVLCVFPFESFKAYIDGE